MRRRNLALWPLVSRREAVVGGLATLAACAGPDGEPVPADSSGPEEGGIDTVIVLMMENRSFDHYLGALSLVEGVAVDGLTADMSNMDADGNVYSVTPTEIDCLPDPPHGWDSSHDQFGNGANDGFVRAYVDRQGGENPGEVMNYWTRAALPITYALADAYSVCDRYFCSVMGPTWPNRFFAHAATSDGRTSNDLPTDGGFSFPTIWTKLGEAGVPWRYYYTDVPFIGLFDGHYSDETVALLEEFVDDALDGKLPPVVWIDPGFSFNDDHPPKHPGLGQELIALIYEALAASPQWGRCLLLITYDEHGGFFDHVPPPTTDDDLAADGFDQLGFRVPSLAIGPWVKQGAVSTVFDHTSWIKLVCDLHGIAPWNARVAAATSLAEVLDADRMAAGDALPAVPVPDWDIDESALPAGCLGYSGPTPPPGTGLARWLAERGVPNRLGQGDAIQRWVRAKRRELRGA